MPHAIHIRPAHPEDETRIRACAEAAFAQYVDAIGKKPAPMVADFASSIAAGHAFVATLGTPDIAGFVIFYREGETVYLDNIAVTPEAAGKGIGKRLMAFCESQAAREGAVSVKLYTNAKMTRNITMYPHLGYAETGRRHENGFDRVFFEKDLRQKPV